MAAKKQYQFTAYEDIYDNRVLTDFGNLDVDIDIGLSPRPESEGFDIPVYESPDVRRPSIVFPKEEVEGFKLAGELHEIETHDSIIGTKPFESSASEKNYRFLRIGNPNIFNIFSEFSTQEQRLSYLDGVLDQVQRGEPLTFEQINRLSKLADVFDGDLVEKSYHALLIHYSLVGVEEYDIEDIKRLGEIRKFANNKGNENWRSQIDALLETIISELELPLDSPASSVEADTFDEEDIEKFVDEINNQVSSPGDKTFMTAVGIAGGSVGGFLLAGPMGAVIGGIGGGASARGYHELMAPPSDR